MIRIGNFINLSVLILLLHSAEARQYECPEPEDVYPCYCEEEDGETLLFCHNFEKPDQIYKALKGLGGHKIFRMSFFKNWILDPLKSDAFKNIDVEKIVFENSTITLSPPQFEGLTNHLKSVEMRACFNSTNPLGSWSLGHLTNLNELEFEGNNIPTLPKNWLKSVPDSLTSLRMERNNIIKLEDEVFVIAKNVKFFILDNNRLTALQRSLFPKPASALRSLSLNHNKLRHLPYDLFTDMPNLRSVEMTNNRLTILEDNVWKEAYAQLTKLDLLDNPLQCDKTIKWLTKASKRPILLYGDCATPDSLKGKSIKKLQEEDIV